jgi:predicted MFS family arabinose efflux permease
MGQHGGVLDALRRRLRVTSTRTPGLDRFAWAQALSGAADALVAVSLAGSLFFNISPEASEEQVLLYLTVNMAPFALLAPLIGPAIDRFEHGHRWIAAALFLLRALCAIGLAFTLLDLALYFFALALLIFAKASGVTRQALVPGLVESPSQLVSANSRLARLNVIAGAVGGGIGAAVLAVSSAPVTLGLAAGAFFAAALAMTRVPDPMHHALVTPTVEYEELHAPRIVATAWAFTVVRAAVGFFTFGLAFALRRTSQPAWMYAAAVVAYGAGSFVGNVVAPVLRRRYREVRLVAGSLGALAVVAAFGALGPSRVLVLLVSVVLGGAASIGRQGFDALVQSQAPEASRGRSFARFETRFQIGWVAGAIVATAVGVPIQVSMAIVAVALIPAAVLYVRSIREAHVAHADDPFDPLEVARRRLDHAVEWRRRGLDRLLVSELASVLELARAGGGNVDPALADRVDALRREVLDGQQPDHERLACLVDDADVLISTLEALERDGRAPGPVDNGGSSDDRNDGDDGDGKDGGGDEPADQAVPAPPAAAPSSAPSVSSSSASSSPSVVGGTSSSSSTDDVVTDHVPSDDAAKVNLRQEN